MNGIFSPQPRPKATFRLFCLPYAGGSSVTFMDWHHWLPADIELVCIDPPGRGARIGDRPIFEVPQLVDQLVDEIQSWLDRPFGLFGHSNGALVAFELARRLQTLGCSPEIVFASAKAAPALIQEPAALHRLSDADFIAELRDGGGTPEEFFDSPELIELFLPVLRADFALSETYRYVPGASLDADLVLLSGTSDSCMTAADQAAWAREFGGQVRKHEVAGGHFFVDEQPDHVTAILAREIAHVRRHRLAACI